MVCCSGGSVGANTTPACAENTWEMLSNPIMIGLVGATTHSNQTQYVLSFYRS